MTPARHTPLLEPNCSVCLFYGPMLGLDGIWQHRTSQSHKQRVRVTESRIVSGWRVLCGGAPFRPPDPPPELLGEGALHALHAT
eukprot:364535-Chlamydomonas_euryale.AAC.4